MIVLMVGFIFVLFFMIVYYGGGGIVFILVLILNIFFIFGVLVFYGIVFMLFGIVGIVLMIGMVVDVNVIIYECIWEELWEGKLLLMVVSDGFQNFYFVIIDVNVMILLMVFVLAYFGFGLIKGFVVVLIIGVFFLLFIVVLVGCFMIDQWLKNKECFMFFFIGFFKNVFVDLFIDWLGKCKMVYIIFGVIIFVGLVFMVICGFELGVDFKGGYFYNVMIEGVEVEVFVLCFVLIEVFEGNELIVKFVDMENIYNVVIDYLVEFMDDDVDEKVMMVLYNGVNSIIGGNIDLE